MSSVALCNTRMKTIEEIRREWLLVLIDRYGGLAPLNEALGRTKTDGTLSQIKNQAPNSTSGKPRVMGSDQARDIEAKLGMARGTLDHPPPAPPDPTTVAGLLAKIAPILDAGPPELRRAVLELALKYEKDPSEGARIAAAINALVAPYDDSAS